MNSLKDINWNHLYYFYETAKFQSIKKAADSLNITKSTLSEQLKKLEARFDQKFFIKGARGIILTPVGLKLFERAKSIFEEGNKLLEEFSSDFIGGYPVIIGIDETISHDLANEFCSQYWDYFTKYGTVNTQREINHDSLIQSLSNGQVDWGISVTKPKAKGLGHAEIGSFKIAFCCSKELYSKFKEHADLLTNIPFAESNFDQNLNSLIYKHLRKYKIVPKEKIYSDHAGFIKKLCDRGRCVTYLPINPLEDYQDLTLFDVGEPIKISLYAIWRKSQEPLVSIRKLKELIDSKLSHLPHRYEDVDLQIEVSDVSDELLK